MFDKKQASLQQAKITTGKPNAFLAAATKQAAITVSGNGAKKYSTTGNDLVDQFGSVSSYKAPREYKDIAKDMSTLWGSNPLKALAFVFYIRLITRVVSLFDGIKTTTTQRGQGLKHEGIFRMMWVAINHPSTFWKNVHLFIAIGSWKDIIVMLSYDLQYNGWDSKKLDWEKMGQLILVGLENPKQSNLLKKYLPQLRANSKCNTLEAQADNMIAKWVCSLLFGSKEGGSTTYKKYRNLKTSGTAHEWQKLISTKNLININFSTIHGRALSLLVSSKFLANNGLEKKYDKWLESQPLVKFTGYVYELCAKIAGASKQYQVQTINKQFDMLVDVAKKGIKEGTSLIVVRDTSGSMASPATGTSMQCGNVAKSLALFFSALLPKGAFANSWIEFHSIAQMRTWKGSTLVEKWMNDCSGYVGGTNFQGVINLLCSIKAEGVDEREFPTGILCISDSEFNPSQLGKTNVETARKSLKQAGFSAAYVKNFQIVLWNLNDSYYENSTTKFETHGETENVFYFSGLDGSVITFLTGMEGSDKAAPKTDVELFDAAMNQEVLNMLQV